MTDDLQPPPLPVEPFADAEIVKLPTRWQLLWPWLIVFQCMLGFIVVDKVEDHIQSTQVWHNAVVAVTDKNPWEKAIPCEVRLVEDSIYHLPASIEDGLEQVAGEELAEIVSKSVRETIVSVDLPADQWAALVESGRAPTPGKAEALAGAFCSRDSVEIDGNTFRVVGKLQRGTSNLAFAYLVPKSGAVDEIFQKVGKVEKGWINPKAPSKPKSAKIAELPPDVKTLPEITPAFPGITTAELVLMIVIAVAGALAQVRLLSWIFARTGKAPTFRIAMAEHKRVLFGIHVVCYGALFVFALVAASRPSLATAFKLGIGETFSKGGLSYVGDAYNSRNILRAAGATFLNNYILHTAVAGMLPSLVIPGFAFYENLMSFALAGMVTSPTSTGFAHVFSFHSMTLTLELEAYVLASFATCVYPMTLWAGFRERSGKRVLQAFKLMYEATVLAGVLLLIAALYEAATIIIFSAR